MRKKAIPVRASAWRPGHQLPQVGILEERPPWLRSVNLDWTVQDGGKQFDGVFDVVQVNHL